MLKSLVPAEVLIESRTLVFCSDALILTTFLTEIVSY